MVETLRVNLKNLIICLEQGEKTIGTTIGKNCLFSVLKNIKKRALEINDILILKELDELDISE